MAVDETLQAVLPLLEPGGVLMGAPYGWGTVFAISSISFIMQAVFKLCHFRARDVQHENLADTFRRIQGKGI